MQASISPTIIIAAAILILVAAALVGLIAGRRRPAGGMTGQRLPYKKQQFLFTRTERSFYEVLVRVVGADMVVFAKVRLSDLVAVERGSERWQSYNNSIRQKHVDFVLCSRREITPLLVIELNDATHDREDRRERDALVDNILRSAGLPILWVRAREAYNTTELSQQIADAVSVR